MMIQHCTRGDGREGPRTRRYRDVTKVRDLKTFDGRITDLEGRRCLMMMVEDERFWEEDFVCGFGDVKASGGILVRLHLC